MTAESEAKEAEEQVPPAVRLLPIPLHVNNLETLKRRIYTVTNCSLRNLGIHVELAFRFCVPHLRALKHLKGSIA